MSKRIARRLALQVLFQQDFSDDKSALSLALETLTYEEKSSFETSDEEYANMLIQGVLACQQELDSAISYFSKGWSLSRLGGVDRAILRLGIYEIRYVESVPYKVTINEAVELAKEFGDVASTKFINGILGSVVSYLEEDKK